MRLLRSAGFRLALSYALVFGASALLLIAALGFSTLNLLNKQLDTAIEADARGLIEQWQDGGLGDLVQTLRKRIEGNVDDDALYLVLDPLGRKVEGNLDAWPEEVAQAEQTYEGPLYRNGRISRARMRRFEGPFGFSLLVGREVESRAALRTLITQTLAWALLLMGVLTLAGAMVVQNLFSRMLSHVSATAAAISAGDLSRRVRISGRG
ncbi:MAG: two-component sensor histidine kinase, partial [Acetobacteraceae bacterium]|nr:two-component sensor histidine kinase [Acetobacteraceae bacterium]